MENIVSKILFFKILFADCSNLLVTFFGTQQAPPKMCTYLIIFIVFHKTLVAATVGKYYIINIGLAST